MTGQNKKNFEEWYIANNLEDIDFRSFYKLPFEMQIGVYLAYYDSLKVYIDVRNFMNCKDYFRFEINDSLKYDIEALPTRNEAYKEAFKQAAKMVNNK